MPNVCLASSTIFSSVLAQPSLRWINITPARCGGVRQLCSSGWRWQGSGREAPVPCWGWLEWAHSLSCAWVWPSPCGSKETSPLFQALSVCLACLSLSHHPCMSISLSVCMYVCMYVSLSLFLSPSLLWLARGFLELTALRHTTTTPPTTTTHSAKLQHFTSSSSEISQPLKTFIVLYQSPLSHVQLSIE